MSSKALTQLDEYRILGRSGLRVSPLCLGTMTFGSDWGWGADETESRAILDAYAEKGGNFIDTANLYTSGTSEKLLGKFLEGRRDQFVVGTKYTFATRTGDPNAGGNQRKAMVQNLETSLKRLRTDYIDLYWVHTWDCTTPIDEVMRGLDDMVRAGKVLYVAASDFPAWKISEANTLADLRGWSRFIAMQCDYSLIRRDAERGLIPMCLDMGIAVMPWSPLGAGILAGKYSREDLEKKPEEASGDGTRKQSVLSSGDLTRHNLRIADRVKKVAARVDRSPAQVALNWMMQQPGIVSPIVGARTLQQLEDNLGCLDFTLNARDLKSLDDISAIDLGFPQAWVTNPSIQDMIKGKITF